MGFLLKEWSAPSIMDSAPIWKRSRDRGVLKRWVVSMLGLGGLVFAGGDGIALGLRLGVVGNRVHVNVTGLVIA